MGSSPKHIINAFIIYSKFVLYLSCEKNENKQKEPGFGPFFLKKTAFKIGQQSQPVLAASNFLVVQISLRLIDDLASKEVDKP